MLECFRVCVFGDGTVLCSRLGRTVTAKVRRQSVLTDLLGFLSTRLARPLSSFGLVAARWSSLAADRVRFGGKPATECFTLPIQCESGMECSAVVALDCGVGRFG